MEVVNPSQREVADVIKLRGRMELALYGPDGKMVPGSYVRNDNVVVTSGRSWVLSRIMSQGSDTNTISYIEVGTSTTAPATGDTALGSASLRIAISTFITGGLTNNPPSWQAQCTFATNQANTTLGEVGLFNSSAAGTMLSHVTFATINKTTSNTLAISYTISN